MRVFGAETSDLKSEISNLRSQIENVAAAVDRVPVLFDTDIGSNVDDALALAYLLRHPRCELLGVTTVSGDVAKRAACAEVVCRAGRRDNVPIHCGEERSISRDRMQPDVPQYEAVRHRPHRLDRPAGTACAFLREAIRGRPGEITLLSLGPLTNLAVLFQSDPEVRDLVKCVVSMGGVFFPHAQPAETNCRLDPDAAARVLDARPPRHTWVGLDVTTRLTMFATDVRERFRAPPLDVVLEMAEPALRERGSLTFNDPLAAAVIFRPELCTFREGLVTVDADPESPHPGRTRFEPRDGGAHRVATDVDRDAFFREFFGAFT